MSFYQPVAPAGANTELQFNKGQGFGASPDLTWDDTAKELGVGGDINLDDGVAGFVTTLQMVTPTANRTISFPNATGTVGLVAGSSGNLVANQSGAYAGVANSSVASASGNITLGSRFISSLNGALSATGIAGVPVAATGTWITGGTATTCKPQVLIEPTGSTSSGWSTSGTGLGVNAASGFTGNLLDLQENGTSRFSVRRDGYVVTSAALFNIGNKIGVGIGAGSAAFLQVASDQGLCWSTTTSVSASVDIILARDAANTLAQRHTTNAQTYRLYNTFTSATNFERLNFRWTTNEAIIDTEAGSGGGTLRGLKIGSAGTSLLGFYGATPVVQPANTVAIDSLLVSTGLRASGGTAAFATDVSRVDSDNGQSTAIKHLTELTTIDDAADTDTTIQIPAGAIVLGVTVRVTTVIPTATTFDVGIAGSLTKFGTGISTAATTTNVGSITPELNASAVSVRITPDAQPADDTGRVRVTIHYMELTAPTS